MLPEAVHGHLEGLILAVLQRGPLHGYAIIEALQQRSGGVLDFPTGSVYPALRRLERAGYVRGAWSTVGGRRRRTYALTLQGKEALAERRSAWRGFVAAIDGVFAE